MNRRKFLANSSLFTISTVVLPTSVFGDNLCRKKLRFGLTTDSHYADREDSGIRYYRQSLDKMQEFVEVMNQEQVDFVIHLGDFKDEDENRREADTLEFLKDIEAVYAKFNGARYHCIGNHDLDSITKRQFLDNVENTGISKEKGYYSFDKGGYHFIVLDPNFHADGRDHNKGDFEWFEANILEEQTNWLIQDLATTRKPTIVLSHFTLFEYFKGKFPYHVNNFAKFQQIFEESDKVKAVFHGHVHEEKFKEINGIHYITQYGMVDYKGLENNSFAIVELDKKSVNINGFKRVSSKKFTS